MLRRNFAQRLLGAFEGDKQRFGVHLPEQALDAAVVHFDRVFEQEHLVDNFLRQLAVELAYRRNNRLFLLRFHQVDDFRCRSHATHFAALEVLAVEQVVQHFGQLRQRGWLTPPKVAIRSITSWRRRSSNSARISAA